VALSGTEDSGNIDSKCESKIANQFIWVQQVPKDRGNRANQDYCGKSPGFGRWKVKYYSYFPGCSLEATAVALDVSTQTISHALDIELVEL